MAEVTAQMIKELRERTGVGMGKCKEALVEANGDMNLAIDNLRKAGMATAVKKQGREAKEGLIGSAESAKGIALVEINAETDFVVKNARFLEFLQSIAQEVAETTPTSLETFLQQKYSKDKKMTIDEYRASIVQAIGENIVIRRLKTWPKKPNHTLAIYSHLGGKIATIIELAGSAQEQELAKALAMHIAAAAPEFISPEKIPAQTLAHEREIAKSQLDGSNKPPAILEKIIDGKIKAYYDQACLLNQKYIRDDAKTVAEVVGHRAKETGKALNVIDFVRWTVGEG